LVILLRREGQVPKQLNVIGVVATQSSSTLKSTT
jgi:hypothetical protein